MSALESNRIRVQRLSGLEIWMFIIGRVLIAFALGIIATRYYPAAAASILWPVFAGGVLALTLAGIGLFKKPSATPPTE